MSTPSIVGYMKDNVCTSIYVHCDGYFEGVGRDLQKISTLTRAMELVVLGDRSTIDGGYHGNQSDEDWDMVKPRVHTNFREFLVDCNSVADYYYIFKDGVWYVGTKGSQTAPWGALTPFDEAVGEV